MSKVDHVRKIKDSKQRTDIGKFSFVNRTIKNWNQLTAEALGTFSCKPKIFRKRVAYRVLVGKPEGKRPPWRLTRRWVDNIRMDLQDVGCGHMDWIGLAQDRDRWRTIVSAVMNLRVP